MGNVSTKEQVREDGTGDGEVFIGVGVSVSEESRVKGSINGSSALAEMITEGQLPSLNTNVISRYQQLCSQAGHSGEGHGPRFIDSTQTQSAVQELSSPAAASLKGSSTATSSSPSVSIVQIPLHAADELGQPWIYLSKGKEESQIQGEVATLIEWKHGGSCVFLEGSWDNWQSRVSLQRAGKEFTVLKFLPAGVYHYKFLVDGKWRHAPDLPCIFDEKGNGFNILDVQNFTTENVEGVVDFEAPDSPDSSYDSPFLGPEDYSKDPPFLPSQLHHNNELEQVYARSFSSSIPGSSISSAKPQHVVLNHLFVETRKSASSPVLALGFTERFRSKYTTVIFHKPVRR